MKNKIIILMAVLLGGLSLASFAEVSERMKSTGENIKGSVQKNVGKATGNKELENEGKINQVKGKLRDAKEDVKDALTE